MSRSLGLHHECDACRPSHPRLQGDHIGLGVLDRPRLHTFGSAVLLICIAVAPAYGRVKQTSLALEFGP